MKNRAWMILVPFCLLSGSILPADTPSEVELKDSVKAISTSSGPAAFVSRTALTAGETAAPLTFELSFKMRNFKELQARVARNEHISADEMVSRYAPAEADYNAALAWTRVNGFTIVRTAPNHLALFARGTVSQVSRAMKVAFARVRADGAEYTSAVTAPKVPGYLANALVGIHGLQPHIRAHPDIIRKLAITAPKLEQPAQIAAAYQATSLYAGDVTGAGQTIAIVDDTFVNPSDLLAFWKTTNVNQALGNIEFVQVVSGALNDPSSEADFDVEWASALAPGAHVRVYGSGDFAIAEVDQAYEQIYEDVTAHPELGIHQMSMSYGYGETYITSSQAQTDDQYFAELAAAGVTVFAASGDQGATPAPPTSSSMDDGVEQVSFPASDPNVTAVGGTFLSGSKEVVWNDFATGQYVGSFQGSTGGGGSRYFNRPAWQTGLGVGTGTMREVPDVASAALTPGGALVIDAGVSHSVLGTSWSSPTWAAFCALLNQAQENSGKPDLGILGPHIYPLLASASTYARNFRDITSGNNIVQGTTQGYTATRGYDMTTGLGSPKVTALAETLTGSTKLTGVVQPPASVSIQPGQSTTLSATVKGATATYQWQVQIPGSTAWSNVTNATPFSGATSATLTISNATTVISGDEFRCQIGLGSTTIVTNPPMGVAVATPLTVSTMTTSGLSSLSYPSGIAFDNSGNIYIADFGNNEVREVAPTGNEVQTFGYGTGDLDQPNAVAFDGKDTMYVAATGSNHIEAIKLSTGAISTFAGSNGEFNFPNGVAVDKQGNVYVANTNDDTVCKVTSNGQVSVLAGQTGNAGYADGTGTQALFNQPLAVAVDGSGNVFVADNGNQVIRKITSNGVVSTLAGTAGVAGYRDGDGQHALFNGPFGVTVDGAGNLYIGDCCADSKNSGNNLVREISTSGAVTTLAGDPGISGKADGTGTAAQFQSAQAVAVNSAGEFYIADTFNQTIRVGYAGTAPKVAYLSGPLTLQDTITPGTLVEGDVVVGGSSTGTLTIFNVGQAPLHVTALQLPAGFTSDWTAGTIAAGTVQTIVVTFSPTQAISYGGNITVDSDADATYGSFTVSGAGVTPPPSSNLSLGESDDFGTTFTPISGSVQFDLTAVGSADSNGYIAIKNPTNVQLQITGVDFPANYTGSFSRTIPANGIGYLVVTFEPTAVGTFSGTVVIHTDFTGAPLSFTVTGDSYGPAVIGGCGVTSITSTSAVFTLNFNPENFGQYISITYGTTPNALGNVAAQLVQGLSPLALTFPVTNLLPNTTYYYAPFTLSAGTVQSFKTPIGQFAGGSPVSQAEGTNVVLSSTVNAGGLNGTAYFQYGTTTAYGSQSALQNVSGTTLLTVSANLFGLEPGTTYHYRLVLTSSAGTIYGPDETVTTSALDVRAILASGQSAPHTSYSFGTLGDPIVNSSNGMAFRATLTGASATGNVGIWANQGSSDLKLIAQTGSAAPDTSGATFATMTDPVYNNNGDVAFGGTLNVAPGLVTGTNESGIWASNNYTLDLLARQGSVAPGTNGATFASFSSVGISDSGGVIFEGTLNLNSSLGVTGANNTGIWIGHTSSDLALILRTGQLANGSKKIASFKFPTGGTEPGGHTHEFASSTGHAAVNVTYTDKTAGIVEAVPTFSPESVAAQHDYAQIGNQYIKSYTNAMINNQDLVAYGATTTGGVPTTGIWQYGLGYYINDITFTAAETMAYSSVQNVDFNDNDLFAFTGVLDVLKNNKETPIPAIFIQAANPPLTNQVALAGSQAPGCATGVTFSTFGAFGLGQTGGADGQGGLSFIATLTGPGVTPTNNTGLFVVDSSGTLQMVARTGDVVSGNTITTISFLPADPFVSGQTRSISPPGDLLFKVTLSDTSQVYLNLSSP